MKLKKLKDCFKEIRESPEFKAMTKKQKELYQKFLKDREVLDEETAFIFALLDYSDFEDKQKNEKNILQ
jgi:hypothetical protein